jgi:hypothetical protein
MKKAFTLMEVNLAMLIIAGGVLSVLGLYSLGYREAAQSRDDVASAAYADAVMSPLVMALSATNVTWDSFRKLENYPSDNGWGAYLQGGEAVSDPESKARSAFNDVKSKLKFQGSSSYLPEFKWPSSQAAGGLKGGLVILHEEDSAIVKIGFRATKKPSELLAMPLYYTEVKFQGVIDEEKEPKK